ncbi:MAG: hypothetical protein Q9213_002344 [Squamulea squamosa]
MSFYYNYTGSYAGTLRLNQVNQEPAAQPQQHGNPWLSPAPQAAPAPAAAPPPKPAEINASSQYVYYPRYEGQPAPAAEPKPAKPPAQPAPTYQPQAPIFYAGQPTLEPAKIWHGPTKAEVDAQNAALAQSVGAYTPMNLVPVNPGAGQQFYCREIDGTYTLRTMTDIETACQPGTWHTTSIGFPYFTRTNNSSTHGHNPRTLSASTKYFCTIGPPQAVIVRWRRYLTSLPAFLAVFIYIYSKTSPRPSTSPRQSTSVTMPGTTYTQHAFTLPSYPRGSHLITSDITSQLSTPLKDVKVGLLHLFLQHTSCAISLNENWDSDVRKDMSDSLDKIVVEDKAGKGIYRHDAEGSDDMPAHIKSSLIGASVSIPITDGKLALGTWQGIWFLEFRDGKHRRKVVATIQGEKA